MRVSKRASAVAISTAVALVAAGCSGDDGGSGKVATADAGIVIENVNPQNPLVPGITNETGGGKIIDFLWTGLVSYPNDGSAPTLAVADAIDTTDSKVYTIKLKSGTKFHDGTEVKAKNFVDAWNWAAYSPNGATSAPFFDKIAGYADVHAEDPDAEGPKKAPTPKQKTMSGLKVVDDHTFQVTLAAPFSIFPTMLGYSAFVPMPDSFFTSKAADFGLKPVGNGPVKFVSWQDKVEINLTRFDDYVLSDKVKIKDVKIKIFTKDTASYQELRSGTLDFQQQVPVSALAGGNWKNDLPGGRAITAKVPFTQILSFPMYDPKFKNPKLRAAISMAIDRQQIADKIFFGTRVPATSWAHPLTPGDVPNNCTVCKFDPVAAKAALAEAGGYSGELVFYYNADASHKDWMEAVAQSIKNTLGINARAEGLPTFQVFRQQIQARKMTGIYRAGWQQDYPDVENWIGPLYVTNGGSNDGLYSNPAVDKLYKEGTSAPTVEAAHAKFAEAVKLIDADVPAIPIFYVDQQSGVSERILGAKTTNVGELDLSSVEIK